MGLFPFTAVIFPSASFCGRCALLILRPSGAGQVPLVTVGEFYTASSDAEFVVSTLAPERLQLASGTSGRIESTILGISLVAKVPSIAFE